MPRILQVNKLYYPWIGGVETIAQDIAEGLHNAEGVTFTNLVCQPKGRRHCDLVNGVKTFRARSWGMISGMPISLDFFRLFRQLARDSDLVILHHPFPLASVAYCLFARKKALVVWFHGDIVRQTLLKIPFLPFIRLVLKRATYVIVSTAAMIKSSATLSGYSGKCRVVHFSIDAARFALTSDMAQKAEKIRRDFGEPLVLSVGRLVYYKGFSYLVNAMKGVPAHLLIIGAGPLKGALTREIEALGLDARVHIIDPVGDLVPYYHSCDIFALPSCEPTEAFGVVQIEAMACGKPVVNTNLPTGVPEVSVDGVTGRTVRVKDSDALAGALLQILSDKDEYRRFSQNARDDVAKRFARERFFAEIQRLHLL